MDDAGDERVIAPRAKESSPTAMSATQTSKPVPEVAQLPDPQSPQAARTGQMSASSIASEAPPSVFENAEEPQEHFTEPTQVTASPGEPAGAYDLNPPPPAVSHSNIEWLSERLFSVDHLNLILRDRLFAHKFSQFLNKYQAQSAPLLARYIETQKAISAIEYANAIADQLDHAGHDGSSVSTAAIVDERFESRSRRAIQELVNDALPGFITHRLVQIVTECLVKEITGTNAPVMRELVQGVAEVFCMTDPSLPDNPIVYASDEFYRTTQYGRDYVIGRNCRFLQGPKSSSASVARLVEALVRGTEICETILNYRRDGSPFMNLLMIAPLYDNKGAVRYFIGCQIDVSNLIEGGRGLESFQQLLSQDQADSRYGEHAKKSPLRALSELSHMLSPEELDLIKSRVSADGVDSGRTTPARPSTARRYLGMDEIPERELWPAPHHGPSGRLPGVYQNYLLVRPYPSLRITFTSAALRIPGLLQSRFLDRVGGPQHVREGIYEALSQGVGVTAKISWLTQSNPGGDRSGVEGKPRWIHCTPLLGSDAKVGVWMVVMVEREEITGHLNASMRDLSIGDAQQNPLFTQPAGAPTRSFTGHKLYTEYLRREGRAPPPQPPQTAGSEISSRLSSPQHSGSVRGGGGGARPASSGFY